MNSARYDAPTYDPLTQRRLPAGFDQNHDTWWSEQAGEWTIKSVSDLPEHVDYVVLGAGYTGLNAALTLAEKSSASVLVIDAGEPGAGASGRNAGFLLPGSGRLGLSDYVAKFGAETGLAVQDEFRTGIDTVVSRVREACALTGDDCQLQPARYLRFAHSNKFAEKLESSASTYASSALNASWLDSADIARLLPGIAHPYGALALEPAYSVQPLRLARAYTELARTAGVLFSFNNPVTRVRKQAGGYCLETRQGTVNAAQLLVCTNAYLPKGIVPTLSRRQFPVMSAINVTAPLSEEQLEYSGLSSNLVMMDTRTLKYYYRLLPDNRLLFGGRGAISGKQADKGLHGQVLQEAMQRTFPMLEELPITHHWSGWVSVSLDSMPRVFSIDKTMHAAMGYCGAGVSFTALAGQRLAEKAMGRALPDLPFYQGAPPRYPFPGLRRSALRLLYRLAG